MPGILPDGLKTRYLQTLILYTKDCMHSAKLTMAKYFSLLILAFSFQLSAFSQENSPYSRYGLGDMIPDHNIVTRGMGGIAAGYMSPRFDSSKGKGSFNDY